MSSPTPDLKYNPPNIPAIDGVLYATFNPNHNFKNATLHYTTDSPTQAYHSLDGHLEELRLGRVELVEERKRLVHHLVVLIVGQILNTFVAKLKTEPEF